MRGNFITAGPANVSSRLAARASAAAGRPPRTPDCPRRAPALLRHGDQPPRPWPTRGPAAPFVAIFLAILLATLAVAACAPALGTSSAYPVRWQPAASLPPHTASLAFSASMPNVGYACAVATGAAVRATPTTPSRATPGSTPTPQPASRFIFVTADGGALWSPLAAPFPQGRACRVFIAALDPRDVFVAEPPDPEDDTSLLSQLWRSRDGGATWQSLGQLSQPGERFSFASVAVVGQRIVVQVGSVGVPRLPEQLYATGDDGKSWQPLAPQYVPADLYAAGAVLYLDAGPSPAPGSPPGATTPPTTLYRSSDAGQTWTRMTVPYQEVSGLRFLLAADGAHEYGVGLIPAATAYGADEHAVIISRDGGAGWTRIDAPPSIGTLSADLLPDGAVLAQSLLPATQPTGGPTGELFRLRRDPPGADTSWELLSLGPYVSSWQVARASDSATAATRLWGVAADRGTPQSYVYVDLP